MLELSVENEKKREAITALKRTLLRKFEIRMICIAAFSEVNPDRTGANALFIFSKYAVDAGMKLYLSLPTYLPRYDTYHRLEKL